MFEKIRICMLNGLCGVTIFSKDYNSIRLTGKAWGTRLDLSIKSGYKVKKPAAVFKEKQMIFLRY